MKFTFAIALLAAVAIAGRNNKKNKNSDQDDFLDFAVKQGKNYKSVEDFENRAKTFKKNKSKIDRMNEKAERMEKRRAKKQRKADKKARRQAKKLAKFASNFTSDLEDEEFKLLLGLSELPERRLLDDVVPEEDGRRHLAADIDWVAAGKMAAVKNQGQCGSCWSFAAGTALEGSKAIKDNTTAVRLSEQSAVDCTSRTCQTGGWMNDAWNFWEAQGGAPSNAAYPYTGKNQACQEDKLNNPVTQIQTYDWVWSNWETALQDGPLTVALEAGSDCFRFYESGILDAEQAAEDGCGNAWDHAVVLVAFTNEVEGTANETCSWDEECTYPEGACEWVDIHCREITPEQCTEKSTCVTISGQCEPNEEGCTDTMMDTGKRRRATRDERRVKTCADGNPTLPNRRLRENKQCAIYEWTAQRCSVEKDCTPAVEECDRINQCDETQKICQNKETCTGNADEVSEGTPAHWTIQNSWSTWWGDQGFIKIAKIEGNMGVLGMQAYMQQPFAV